MQREVLDTARELVGAIDELLTLAPEVLSRYEDELRGLSTAVSSARTGFPLILDERCAQEIDRLGSVLLGPIFTSHEYPWPVDERARPMAPLCQLNTNNLPKTVEGVQGLIQIWLTQTGSSIGDTLIRVIPTQSADPSLFTPIITHDKSIQTLLPDAVEWLGEIDQPSKPSRKQYISDAARKFGYADEAELSDANWDEWMRLAEEYANQFGDGPIPCWQISGFESSRLYCDISADQKKAVHHLRKAKSALDGSNNPSNAKIVQLIQRLLAAFDAWIELCGDSKYPCLFGTFHPIQYPASERDEPILCFESVGSHEWGDSGNAQLFYSKAVGFYFDWSCF